MPKLDKQSPEQLPEIDLEEIKVLFNPNLIIKHLPMDLKKCLTEEYDYLVNRVSFLRKMKTENPQRGRIWINEYKRSVDQFNSLEKFTIDDRMTPVWIKISKLNSKGSSELFNLISGQSFSKIDASYNYHSHKISVVKKNLKLCWEFVDKIQQDEAIYSSYNPSAPKSNSRLFLHGDVTDALYGGFEEYVNGLEKIIAHYERHKDVFDRLDYKTNPISRKKSIKNFKAIYLARKIKLHFLEYYKKPMNKEISVVLDVLFGDESGMVFDSDYVAKVTKDADKTFKDSIKMEDSPEIYDYKQSF